MQDQTDKVAGNEDDGVCVRCEAGVVHAVNDNEAREREVDCRGEEGGADGQGYEVPGRLVR